jgi:hypothetical protein
LLQADQQLGVAQIGFDEVEDGLFGGHRENNF